jgi:hypothetical protein
LIRKQLGEQVATTNATSGQGDTNTENSRAEGARTVAAKLVEHFYS